MVGCLVLFISILISLSLAQSSSGVGTFLNCFKAVHPPIRDKVAKIVVSNTFFIDFFLFFIFIPFIKSTCLYVR